MNNTGRILFFVLFFVQLSFSNDILSKNSIGLDSIKSDIDLLLDYNNLAGKVAGPNPFTTDLNPLGNTYNIAPKYLPSPLKVIVSPHVPYRAATGIGTSGDQTEAVKVTDIYMADSANCGLLMTKEGVSMDEWNDPERDIRAMKLKERWGMALLAQGKGVACARDVVLKDNYVFDNVNDVGALSGLQAAGDVGDGNIVG